MQPHQVKSVLSSEDPMTAKRRNLNDRDQQKVEQVQNSSWACLQFLECPRGLQPILYQQNHPVQLVHHLFDLYLLATSKSKML